MSEEAPGNKTNIIFLRTEYRNHCNNLKIGIVIKTAEQSGTIVPVNPACGIDIPGWG
uniref:Uncharacterized protein n=1 Tax=Enterobacter cloacae TaxID=550 RepID=A0A482M5A6_ENTCL|nr:hypothetical protein [Enterobacter cloacae]